LKRWPCTLRWKSLEGRTFLVISDNDLGRSIAESRWLWAYDSDRTWRDDRRVYICVSVYRTASSCFLFIRSLGLRHCRLVLRELKWLETRLAGDAHIA
jgi:hypothetical protein